MTFFSFFLGLWIPAAQAQDLWGLWQPACSPLQPGCGQGPANIFLSTFPNLAIFMLQLATGLAVLFIVWAGFQLVLNMGDEGKVGNQKTGIFFALAGLFVAIVSQLAVSFVATQNWGQNAGGNLPINVLASAVGSILILFNGVFVLAIVYYGVRMLLASGDSGGFGSAKTGITWAIAGAIIVNLANALVQGITSFFAL
jgi:hypothetical protein